MLENIGAKCLSKMALELPEFRGQPVNEAEGGRRRAFHEALATLEFYMKLGREGDAREGAKLYSYYRINERSAFVDTRGHYREHRDLLDRYVSISNDIYGYEFTSTSLGTVLGIAGGVYTVDGIGAEFEASMVWQDNQWLIWSLQID